MKKYLLPLFTMLLLCPVLSQAQKIKQTEAIKIAKIAYEKHKFSTAPKTKDIIPLGSSKDKKTIKEDTLLYIIPFDGGGYTIVSGDKVAPPYLGFCSKGTYDEKTMPPGLLYLIDKYKNQISDLKGRKATATEEVKKQWENIYNPIVEKSAVAPLLDTEWSQQSGFNDLCPNGNPAGCVAVAMAQILRYWECRNDPTGQLTWIYNGVTTYANFGGTTYMWDQMDNTTSDPYNRILIYHAGVSCKMKYGSSGSTSGPDRALDGFEDYWGIDHDADVKWRATYLHNWSSLLRDEVHDGRPVLYSAGGAEIGDDWVYGHSWVIDGITVDHANFHCNWGWSGGDYNGWYSIGDFNPQGNNYNQIESAIVNISPEQPVGLETPVLTETTFTYNPNGYILDVGDVFGATDYTWSTSCGTIIGTGSSVTLNTDKYSSVTLVAENEACNLTKTVYAGIFIEYGPITSSGDPICYSNGTTLEIQNVPGAATVTWSGNNLSFPNGNTGNPILVKTNNSLYSGEVTVTASVSVPGQGAKTYTLKIWAGKPQAYAIDLNGEDISMGVELIAGTYNTIQAEPFTDMQITDYDYDFPSGFWVTNGAGTDYVTVSVPSNFQYAEVPLTVENVCGTNVFDVEMYSYQSAYSMVFAPNPSNGETTITIQSSTSEETIMKSVSTDEYFDEDTEWEYEVYNTMQSLKARKTKIKGKSTKLNTQVWKEGVYTVRVKYKDEILTGKLVVK